MSNDVYGNRVRESTSTTGTATLTLNGAPAQFQTFLTGIGSGKTCRYTLLDGNGNGWDVGDGTVGSGTLARTAVLNSSAGGAHINLSASVHQVFVTPDATAVPWLNTLLTTRQLTLGPAETTLDPFLQDSVEGYIHLVGTQNQFDVGIGVEIQGPDVQGLNFQVLAKGGSFTSYGVVGSCVAGAAATPEVVGVLGNSGTNSVGAVTNSINVWSGPGNFVSGGAITNQYGLKIEDQTIGTNNWAIKTGAGKHEFGNGNTGFFGATGVAKPTVTGSKGANAALASLMTALAALGLVTDSTT